MSVFDLNSSLNIFDFISKEYLSSVPETAIGYGRLRIFEALSIVDPSGLQRTPRLLVSQ